MGNLIWCQLLINISFLATVNSFDYQMPAIDQCINQHIIPEIIEKIEHY